MLNKWRKIMDEKLLYKLKKIDHLIVQMIFKNCNNTQNRQPSRTQAKILDMLINSNGEISQKEIEEKLNVSRATISETLTKMEKYEMIKRESGTDSRTKIIKLTEKSIEIHKYMTETFDNISNKIENILSEEETKRLKELLIKLSDGLEKEVGG
jgi:DNA-binding MarR family transcriptional regulator